MLKTNHYVYDHAGNPRELGNEVARGGEGRIYKLKNKSSIQLLIKIYHDRKKAEKLEPKIEQMVKVSKNIERDWIAWPLVMVYDRIGSFIGYGMKEKQGKILNNVMSPQIRNNNFQKWDRRKAIKTAIELCNYLSFLHHNGIVIGDLNPRNILVNQKGDVALIDCDSYQFNINGNIYYCDVITPECSPPELIISQNSSINIRSIEQDNFSTAVLLFQLFMDGRNPFDHVGGDAPAKNIIDGKFPYGSRFELDENANLTNIKIDRPKATIPPGNWYKKWKGLPFIVKGAFIDTFMRGHKSPNKRTSLSSWISVLSSYEYMLKKGWVPTGWDIDDNMVKRAYKGKKYLSNDKKPLTATA
jgi:DNA-binding helix-hairpin-helix protein with protein kinase domain